MKQNLINQLKACTTQDEVDKVIRENPVIFAEDVELNNVAYNIRYRIEANKIFNTQTQIK